ncbi:MAG: sortase [Candidatus Saccharibacteria bacterium]
MRPDEANTTPAITPATPQRPAETLPRSPTSQQAAAELLRGQISGLYATGPAVETDNQTNPSQLEDVNPYDRTHTSHPQPQPDQWQQYHSAWQTYYQKYYEGYYAHHLKYAKKALQAGSAKSSESGYFANQPDEPAQVGLSSTEALYDLRQKLLTQVQGSAKKVRKSRHFIPIASGLIVVLLFVFLQYNRVIIGSVVAYVSPGSIDPQNIVLDPTTDINVGPDPRLIIPKINVDVPVHYDVGNDYASQMEAMASGLAHFAIPGASSHPGQIGNTVLSGHSSNDLLDSGDYKFIFAQLEKMNIGDSIYANYGGKRYTYTITKKEVVKPTDVSKLAYVTTKPVMTLITCTPVGTSLNRLLVTAEQVSPDPNASLAAPAVTASTHSQAIPGSSPTFFERLFGAKP